MSIKRALTTAVWFLCLCAPLIAQEERPLNVKIADSIREHEPEWLLTREEPAKYYESCKCDTMDAVWAKGGARLFYVVYTHKSKEEADAAYQHLMEFYKFSNAKPTDENYLAELQYHYLALDGPGHWYPSAGTKLYMYFLRRGREVLMVAGDTPELVKRFSALIAAEFPAT
jgi:hypothetical protein